MQVNLVKRASKIVYGLITLKEIWNMFVYIAKSIKRKSYAWLRLNGAYIYKRWILNKLKTYILHIIWAIFFYTNEMLPTSILKILSTLLLN